MVVRSLVDLLARQDASGRPYLEFLRSDAMSLGVYVLEAGAVDRQSPHAQDEVYIVVAGAASFAAGEVAREVGVGDVIFVPAQVRHFFHDIRERLELIVVFAPPESAP